MAASCAQASSKGTGGKSFRKRPASHERERMETLSEKMDRFRASGGSIPMPELSAAEQKQLSSKFNYAIEKSGMKPKLAEDMAQLGKGQKHAAHQETLRAFILAGGVNDTFMRM